MKLGSKNEIMVIVGTIAAALVIFFILMLLTGSLCFCYVFVIIAVILSGVILFYAIRLYYLRPKDENDDNSCLICGRYVVPGKEEYCPSWKSRTRRCMTGPYCSNQCLKEHHKQTRHEHNLMGSDEN